MSESARIAPGSASSVPFPAGFVPFPGGSVCGPAILVTIDRAGRVASINEAGAALVESPATEVVGGSWIDRFVPVQDRARVREVFEGLLSGELERFGVVENDVVTASGEVKTVLWHNTVLRDERGAASGTMSLGIDVTERNRSLRELRRSQEELALRNRINGIFLTCDDDRMFAQVLAVALATLRSELGTFGYFHDSGAFVTPALTREVYWDRCEITDKSLIFDRGHFGGMFRRAVDERRTLIDNSGPFRAPPGHVPIRNSIVTPVLYKDRVISAIHLANAEGCYTDEDQRRLEVIAAIVAPTLHSRLERAREEAVRREAEEQLRRSEERYRELVRSMSSALAVYEAVDDGEDFVFRDFNRRAEEMEGIRREDLVGRRVTDVFPGVKEFGIFEVFQRVWRTGVPDGHPPKLYRDETSTRGRWRENHVYKLPSGELVALYDDVTATMTALEELRSSREELARYLEVVESMLVVFDTEARIVLINRKGCSILGRAASEVVGTPWFDRFIPERLREELLKRFRRVIDGEQDVPPCFEAPVVNASGEERLLAQRDSVIRDAGGSITGMVSVCEDITQRRRDEQERERLQTELLQSQKMESLGTLAGGIAHDFNNLLTTILGNVSLLEMDLREGASEELREVKVAANRGAELAQQLLAFARRGKYDPKPIDLNRTIERTSRMFGRTRKDLALRLDLEHDLPSVLADRTQIDQVLLNLLVNAGQAMPGGGEVVVRTSRIELSENEAKARALAPGRFVRLSVSDTGVGMDEETRARIFEPFFTTKCMGQGTGLGLASVFGIVRNHGGHIQVESAPGEGAIFHVDLPASDRAPVDAEGEVATTRRGGGTILVVDDEEPVARVSARMLRAMGYEAMVAHSGSEALALFREKTGTIGLVLLDMVMPGMSGRETFEALRALSPDVKVLLASGYSEEGQASEILASGCNGFIQKPFDTSRLSAKLSELLR